VERFFPKEEARSSMLQYKPYIIRINALSRSMIALNQDDKAGGIEIIEAAMHAIDELPEIDTTIFQFERMRSVSLLKETLDQIKSQNVTEVEQLEGDLATAVENENYEKAAQIRDAISILRQAKTAE